ncbi:cytochrome c family protein [Gilvimarinus sp. DA14]|uniref:cytochrome c family protein n=1 Tax=Gilvimarinus sp. DA14 TaxID=2956798 RepID=UPI0020B654F5|nr:cytochrome c family protein [Gilvimarinus sp. DA14]UTF59074.1 cytochrome c family protein [Gilvimarinus sp. DA14]
MQFFKLTIIISCIFCSVSGFAKTPIEQKIIQEVLTPQFNLHRASTSSGELIPAHQFDDAQVCGACHTEIFREWRSSMMSHAWDDPIYRALLARASKATNGKLDNFCTGCHTPTGLVSGSVSTLDNQTPPDIKNPETDMPGVDCESCHNISALSGLDNGAYIMNSSAGAKIKFGPRRDAESPYHQTAYSSVHTDSAMCASCHNVTHPGNGVPVERTYDEWYESPYREAGIGCQDCHMPPVKGKSAIMGPERSDRATHYFAGGNTTILEHFGRTKNADNVRKLLRSSGQIELLEQTNLEPGKLAAISLKVSNTGAGHKLPTGFPEGREVWIDLAVTDANNREIYRLGKVEQGKTEPGTKNFMVKLGDKEGKKVEVEVWRITHVISDNRILPKGHEVVDYRFSVPEDAIPPFRITAKLHYWPFSQAFADELLGPGKIQVIVETIDELHIEIEKERAVDISARL